MRPQPRTVRKLGAKLDAWLRQPGPAPSSAMASAAIYIAPSPKAANLARHMVVRSPGGNEDRLARVARLIDELCLADCNSVEPPASGARAVG